MDHAPLGGYTTGSLEPVAGVVFGPLSWVRMSTFMVRGFLPTPYMRTNALAAALVSVLVIAGLGAGGAFAATSPLQPQQSTTNTTTTAPTASGGSATGAATSGAGTAAASDGPSITFNDQQSSGETVLVQSATLPSNGFIVINGTSNGAERILGSSYLLNAGLADNVRIELNQPINGSASLTAILYTDSNGNGAFDADADQPVYQGDSDRRIVDIADITVQDSSGTPTNTGGESAGDSTSAATAADSGGAGTAAANDSAGTSAGSNGSSGNASGESTSSNGPGFGPVIAVVALLAVAFLARRR